MPLLHIIQINSKHSGKAKVGIWHISEPEDFFRDKKIKPAREIHHPHKLLQHLTALHLLQTLETEFPLCEIKIADSQKPYLLGDSYFFSLAHSGNYAAAIVSKECRVGIDIEIIGTKVQKITHKFLTPREQAFLNKEKRIEHLSVCWSAKEAVYKWNGGRGVDFRENIHLQPFAYTPLGSLDCLFTKDGHSTLLHLHYRVEENNYCVCWVVA